MQGNAARPWGVGIVTRETAPIALVRGGLLAAKPSAESEPDRSDQRRLSPLRRQYEPELIQLIQQGAGAGRGLRDCFLRALRWDAVGARRRPAVRARVAGSRGSWEMPTSLPRPG